MSTAGKGLLSVRPQGVHRDRGPGAQRRGPDGGDIGGKKKTSQSFSGGFTRNDTAA